MRWVKEALEPLLSDVWKIAKCALPAMMIRADDDRACLQIKDGKLS